MKQSPIFTARKKIIMRQKCSEIYPFLVIIEHQTGLNIKYCKQEKKAVNVLTKSILYN